MNELQASIVKKIEQEEVFSEALYFSNERELRNFFKGIGVDIKRFKKGAYRASIINESNGVFFSAYSWGKKDFLKLFDREGKIVAFVEKFKRGAK